MMSSSRRFSSLLPLIVAVFAMVSVGHDAAGASTPPPPAEEETVADLISGIRDDLAARPPGADRDDAIRYWIERLEEAIEFGSPVDAGTGLWFIHQLHEELSEHDAALDALTRIIGDPEQSIHLVLSAKSRSIAVSVSAGRSVEETLGRVAEYEQDVAELRRLGEVYSEHHDEAVERLWMTRASILSAAADRLVSEGMSGRQNRIDAADLYRNAAMIREEHLATVPIETVEIELHANQWWMSAMLRDRALQLREEAGDGDRKRRDRSELIDLLLMLVEDFSATNAAQNASARIPDLLIADGRPWPEIIATARTVSAGLAPGHAFLNQVRRLGSRLTAEGRLELANELFDLVMQRAEEWYGDESRVQTNFRWALLQGAVNASRLGDIDGAADRLALMSEVSVEEPFFSMLHSQAVLGFAEAMLRGGDSAIIANQSDDLEVQATSGRWLAASDAEVPVPGPEWRQVGESSDGRTAGGGGEGASADGGADSSAASPAEMPVQKGSGVRSLLLVLMGFAGGMVVTALLRRTAAAR